MNHVIIAGHLGADPEVRFTSSGEKVTTLRVAARSRRKGKTIWWKVTIWGEQFDKMMPYFKKGSPIFVIGEINEPEIFTDRAGNPQPSMSLTAYHLSFSPFGRPDGAGGSEKVASEVPHTEMSTGGVVSGQAKETSFSDEEVPF
jgi:single-strand DNA-binding protein